MKHSALISAFLLCTFFALGQTVQNGYVKTRGRLDPNGQVIPGERIDGAAIILTGGHSTVSGSNGYFKLTIPDKKYFLKNVQKQGYCLADPEVLNRQYQYSSDPLVITMEIPDVLLSEQLAKERRLRRELQTRLNNREDEIQAMNISLEEKKRLLAQVDHERDDNEKIVKQLAQYYVTIDYDQLNDFQRQVNAFLEHGELEKADSLLRTLAPLSDRIAEVRKEQEVEANRAEELARGQQELEKSQAGTQQKLENIATDCLSFYQRFLLDHQNDSAAHYIELRASLDTTNVEWQLKAGAFLEEYLAEYDKAIAYYQRGARHARASLGEHSSLVATCYCDLGAVYTFQGKYTEAFDYLNKALDIRKELHEENQAEAATVYNNMGAIYDVQGQFPSAIEYYQKALDIRKASLGENHRDVARSYNNLGKIYNNQGKYALALECFQTSLRIYDSVYKDENQQDIAMVYNNMGNVYFAVQKYDTAIAYNKKALDIWKTVYNTEKHPQVALAYNNIGVIYFKMKDYDKAIENDMKALAIKKAVYGEHHPEVAGSYNNVGTEYLQKKDYSTANDYYQKAVDILISFYGETHPDLAIIYKNMGKSSSRQGDHKQAVAYYQKVLDIRKVVYGEVHPEVAIAYNNLGAEYTALKEYDMALKYMQLALDTRIAFFKSDNYDIAADYGNIGYVYYLQGNTKKAVKYLQKSVDIMKSLPNIDPAIIKAYMEMIGEVKASKKKKK